MSKSDNFFRTKHLDEQITSTQLDLPWNAAC